MQSTFGAFNLRISELARTRVRYLAAVNTVLLALADLNSRVSPCFVINFTESVPAGVYRILDASEIRRGMYVAFKPPAAALTTAEGRPWFRKDKYFVKQVIGLSGDEIYIKSGKLSVNNDEIAQVLDADRQGVAFAVTEGCYHLSDNQIFVMGLKSTYSFDSRYFGPIDTSIVQKVSFLLSFEQPLKGPSVSCFLWSSSFFSSLRIKVLF